MWIDCYCVFQVQISKHAEFPLSRNEEGKKKAYGTVVISRFLVRWTSWVGNNFEPLIGLASLGRGCVVLEGQACCRLANFHVSISSNRDGNYEELIWVKLTDPYHR